jgi:hypothetical protein
MPYQVDRYNGTFLVNIPDGTVDTTTDLRLVGKNYAGYGEVQNENFLHLLENFSNTTAPPKAVSGQIWYDSGNKKLKFYDSSRWRATAGSESSLTAPSGQTKGDFWFDESADQLYVYNGTDYVLVGPPASPALGASTTQSATVKDTGNTNHAIVKLIVADETVAIFSNSESFTLNPTLNPIDGFTTIKKGVTLKNANSTTGVTSGNWIYWGTASDSSRLGGRAASEYLLASAVVFSGTPRFIDTGFTVGNDDDIKVFVEASNRPVIQSSIGQSLTLRISSSGVDNDVAKVTLSAVEPGLSNTYSLGTSTKVWQNVFATLFTGDVSGNVTGNLVGNVTGNTTGTHTGAVIGNVTGNLTGTVIGDATGTAGNATLLDSKSPSTAATINTVAVRDSSGNITANRFVGIADDADQLLVGATYRSSSLNADPNTVVARDGSANITANLFNGTATAARYADLAEKYLADQDYEVGTVVAAGGEAEVRATVFGDRAIGVVSANPAFMMNKDLEGGTYIALKGRVPVKVVGSIRKGDRIVATDSGCGLHASFHQHPDVFAVALESSNDVGVKLIECIIL